MTAVARVVAVFLRGNLSVLLILLTLIAGAVSLLVTPREEEPQIVVPLADVIVRMPGASAREVELQVATRLEKLLHQIDGVEYVYSMSRPGMAVITVRFYVGEDREDSLIKLYNKIAMHTDNVPPGVTGWVVKPIEIDDVPIVDVTLWSERADGFELRRIAEQVELELQAIPKTGRTEVVGGRSRQISIWLDSKALAAHQVSPLEISRALEGANVNLPSGSIQRENRQLLIESGSFLSDVAAIGDLVVGVDSGRPVYLRDVARIEDGPEYPKSYTRIGFGPADADASAGATVPADAAKRGETVSRAEDYPAVTIAVAKQKGSNAVRVA
ncbi:MAG: efflux RND transporter permease subunit, partial [Pirellulales bacterium]